MNADYDARLEALETKIAFQEHTIAQLNEVIIAQRDQLDRLEALCQALRDKLQSQSDADGADPNAHEPPPHY